MPGCARRAEAPSSAVVVLLVGSVRSFASVYHSRDGSAEGGKGDFRSMRTRRYLMIVSGSQFTW
jgi:hypothetical protein